MGGVADIFKISITISRMHIHKHTRTTHTLTYTHTTHTLTHT